MIYSLAPIRQNTVSGFQGTVFRRLRTCNLFQGHRTITIKESTEKLDKDHPRRDSEFALQNMIAISAFMPLMFGLVVPQVVPFDQTLPVLTNPVLQVNAGDFLFHQ